MPYYHVYIDIDGDELAETDLSKEQLMEYIVKPYLQNKEFMCKGSVVDPDFVTTIRIFESEQSYSELKQTRGAAFLEMLGRVLDINLLEEKGREVTRDFITTRRRKRRRKTARKKKSLSHSRDVFIVHGSDHETLKELRAMLSEFGLNPIVLHEQPSGSRTIVEKLEKYSDVGFAFVILTPDDRGFREATSQGGFGQLAFLHPIPRTAIEFSQWLITNLRPRARQNVVLEFGYFIGKLGRDRVCCLYKGNVELPSDMHGILYIPFVQSPNEIKEKIAVELRAAGYEIKQ